MTDHLEEEERQVATDPALAVAAYVQACSLSTAALLVLLVVHLLR